MIPDTLKELESDSEARRKGRYKKDPNSEESLTRINLLLEPIEHELIRPFTRPKLPLLFIIGPPRSGTTLLAQLLAFSGGYSYVSNFSARFWLAPYLGMSLEKALGLREKGSDYCYDSLFGVTRGLAGPHEFGYFWRRWFAYRDTHKLATSELMNIDAATLLKELGAMENVYGLPMFFKNLVCGLQAKYLAERIPTSFFVICKRNIVYNMQSLLLAREEVFGDRNVWFSLRPKEYPLLKSRPPYEQVAGQIYFTLKDITEALRGEYTRRVIEISYESLCADPRREVQRISRWISESGQKVRVNLDALPAEFDSQNLVRLPMNEFEALDRARKQFFRSPA